MQIRQLLFGIENLDIVLPEFQREYVWSLEHSKQLFVSLYKSYPTGSLLFWEAKADDVPEIKNNAIGREKTGLTKIILDGQQRITTLYLIIKGTIPPYYTETDLLQDPRHLFFNLKSGEFKYYLKMEMEDNVLWQKVTGCFDLKKVNAIDIAKQFSKDHPEEDFMALASVINDNLNKLRYIEQTDYHIQVVPSSAKLDEAIDVFDRVNSLGTKLTDAELVLTHITGKWPHARRELKERLELLKKEQFEFTLDFLTRCTVVALTDSALFTKNAKLNYEVFTREDYIAAWKKVIKAFDFVLPVLKQDALITSSDDMTTQNVLVPVITYLIKNESRMQEPLKHGFIYWMTLASLWSRYSSQTDARLDKDVNTIINNPDPIQKLVAEIIDQRGRTEVSPADLEGREAGHPFYRMLYIITKYKKAIDWSNGGPIYGTLGPYHKIQEHHIFPQSKLYSHGYDSANHMHKKTVNEIANRAFITRDANFAINNKDPEKYLPEIEKKFPGSLERQFIPMDPSLWTYDNYEQFLKQRRIMIAAEINAYVRYFKDRHELKPASPKETDWKSVIEKGENDFTEFKSSIRWDYKTSQINKNLEYVIAKTISGFLNSEGGTLFIGVDDAKNILGIANDLRTLGSKQDKDGFQLKLSEIVNGYLGKEFHHYIGIQFATIDSQEICVVEISRSQSPVYLKRDGKDEFFIRAMSSTQPMGLQEAHDYIAVHWGGK